MLLRYRPVLPGLFLSLWHRRSITKEPSWGKPDNTTIPLNIVIQYAQKSYPES
ncbi:hypothetical protein HMPREF1548_03796 [Clostridium sp. KLE 1755]|nr:hypothetical protein HMPREF1548_03796 [Clostridium sp. KLE 1755]